MGWPLIVKTERMETTTAFSVHTKTIGNISTILNIVEGFLPDSQNNKSKKMSADEKMVAHLRARTPEGDAWLLSKRKIIFSVLHKLNAPSELIEDFYQEAVVRLLNKIQGPAFKVHTSLSAYLIRIAKFAYFNHIRYSKSMNDIGLSEHEDTLTEQTPTHDFYAAQDTSTVKKVLSSLPNDTQELLLGIYYNSLEYEDIVRRLHPELFNPYREKEIKKVANRLRFRAKYWMDKLRVQLGGTTKQKERFIIKDLVLIACIALANDISNIPGIPVYAHENRSAFQKKWGIDPLGVDEAAFEWLFSTFTVQELVEGLNAALHSYLSKDNIRHTDKVLEQYLPMPDHKSKHNFSSSVEIGDEVSYSGLASSPKVGDFERWKRINKFHKICIQLADTCNDLHLSVQL